MRNIDVQRLADEARFNRFHGLVLFWCATTPLWNWRQAICRGPRLCGAFPAGSYGIGRCGVLQPIQARRPRAAGPVRHRRAWWSAMALSSLVDATMVFSICASVRPMPKAVATPTSHLKIIDLLKSHHSCIDLNRENP